MRLIENDLSKDLCDAVNDHGGFAKRIAHRFLIGVPDMMVVMPDRAAMLLEAKLDDLPVKLSRVTVTLTVQQHRFLKQSHDVGMAGNGVASFLKRGDRFAVAFIPIARFDSHVLAAPLAWYSESTVKTRKATMIGALQVYDSLFGRN